MATKNTQKQTTQGKSFLHDWILPLIFLFTLPPVGLALFLIFFFFRGTIQQKQAEKKKKEIRPAGARITVTPETRAAVKSAPFDATSVAAGKARKLAILGGVMAVLFALAFVLLLTDSTRKLLSGMDLINQVITPLCYSISGVLLFLDACGKRKQVRRYRRYLFAMKHRSVVTISELSSATGRSVDQVRKDLQEMMDNGLFLEGYMDCGGEKLALPPA